MRTRSACYLQKRAIFRNTPGPARPGQQQTIASASFEESLKTWVLPFNLSILFRKRGSMRKACYPLSKCFVFLLNLRNSPCSRNSGRISDKKRSSPLSSRLLSFFLLFLSFFLLSSLLLLSLFSFLLSSFFLLLCSFSFLHARRVRYPQKRAIFRNTPGPASSIPSRLRHLSRSTYTCEARLIFRRGSFFETRPARPTANCRVCVI